MTDPDIHDGREARLSAVISTGPGELNEKVGVVIVSASSERIVATMPVEGNRQPMGLLHGGASAVLAETLGSVHANVLAPPGTHAVGIELNCSHHRSASTGIVTGTSTPVHVGRSVATFQIMITDEQDKPVCTARLTCFFRPAAPVG